VFSRITKNTLYLAEILVGVDANGAAGGDDAD
jgi:hypothetical protein